MSSDIEIIGSIQEENIEEADESIKSATPKEATPEPVKDLSPEPKEDIKEEKRELSSSVEAISPEPLKEDEKIVSNGMTSEVEMIGSVEEVKEQAVEGLS